MKEYFKGKVYFLLFLLISIMLTGCEENSVENTPNNMSESVVLEESSNDAEVKKKEVKNRSDEVAAKKKEIHNLVDKAESVSKEPANSAAYSGEKATIAEVGYDFLRWSGYGSFDSLTGDIVVKVYLIDDTQSQWNEKDALRLKSLLESGTERLIKEANAYGNNLTIQLEYSSCEIDISVQDNEDDGEKLLRELNLFDDEIKETDTKNPFIFAVNQIGRSAAFLDNIDPGVSDYIVFYTKYDDENTYIHELLHCYGAADYYYHDDMSKLADQYLPQSIMNRFSDYENPIVDELTAYLIGWCKETTANAEKFIMEVNKIKAQDVMESDIDNGRDGYVEDLEIQALLGGRYTGELKTGLPHGYGKIVWDDGTHHQEYEGYWQNGFMEGQGTMIHNDGTVEKGIWKEGTLIEPN